MMASVQNRKAKRKSTTEETNGDEELFVDAPPDVSDDDSTDSEESEYSGLEEEEDSSSEDEDEEEEEDEDDASESDESGDDEETERFKKINNDNNNRKKQAKMKSIKGKVDNVPATDDGVSSSGGVSLQPPTLPDEYDYDSSDEEDVRNTVGNIPMEWYREFEHLGYDWDGKKIAKPKAGDRLDEFLSKMENPDYWRSVLDKTTGQNVVLSEQDVDVIERFKKGKFVDASYDPYEPWVDFFTYKTMQHPVTNHPAHKRSFIPSRLDRLKVGRMVHAIKMGWMKPSEPKKKEEEEDDQPQYYMIWDKDDQSDILKRHREHIPAPKMLLPGHEESYNPPPEYLLNEEEIKAWKEKEPEERKMNFIPQKFSSLRQVPMFKRFINERFERCLDLYLCPRQRKMRMNVNPEDLLPRLPKPKDLQPFPTTEAILYRGHSGMVRSISADPTGQWLVSGSDDSTVKFWEVSTGRCMKTLTMEGVVRCVAWNPNASLCLVAAVVENTVHILNPKLGDKLVITNTDNMINSYEATENSSKLPVEWQDHSGTKHEEGFRVQVTQPKKVAQLTWHNRGDYFAAVMPDGGTMSVLIHQLSKRRSQNPFRKSKGLVQRVLFHPTRPFLFMATQRYIRVYNLLKQELTKKLLANCKWVSSMAVHPTGDNLLIGSYDCRTSWFDLDLSNKPYQTLRHHKKAVRQVCYHKSYPLFASASDDGTVIVCHGRVFSDLLQNPMIVPVKVLRGHAVKNNLGVLDCHFHPTQPWIFTAGADNTVRLFT